MNPLIPVFVGGAVIFGLATMFKSNKTLTFHVYEADGGTWTFAIYKGDKLVYQSASEVFADQAAAETAAKIWISNNPNAGR